MLRYLTAGESHGKSLMAILEGMPAGLKISKAFIDRELARRQRGYGRGGRMKIEKDSVRILSGTRKQETIGSPLAVIIDNRDSSIDRMPTIFSPRPGHADLAGALKYDRSDIRDILERSSARETAVRVAVGAICKLLLAELGIDIAGHVATLGKVEAHTGELDFSDIKKAARASTLGCADRFSEGLMRKEIDRARKEGDTLGGSCEIIIVGHPPGLGSHVQWDRKIDARLAMALMSIQAVKAVEIGSGISSAAMRGSQVHDPIAYGRGRFLRSTNNAGGIEGGMTNGKPIIARVYMKPISTLRRPLDSVNIKTKKKTKASVERSDVCAVPSCAVIAENISAYVMAALCLEKFGSDSLRELKANYASYLKMLKTR